MIQIKETTRQTINAKRVFLIFVVEKYTQITYTKVSLDAISSEAATPGNESGPYLSKSSRKTASAPPPVNGRIKIKGNISLGNPKKSNAGERSFVK